MFGPCLVNSCACIKGNIVKVGCFCGFHIMRVCCRRKEETIMFPKTFFFKKRKKKKEKNTWTCKCARSRQLQCLRVDILHAVSCCTLSAGLSVFDRKQIGFSSNTLFLKSIYNVIKMNISFTSNQLPPAIITIL